MRIFKLVLLEFVNFVFNRDWFYILLGKFNKRRPFIESIFLAYPGNKEYSLAYSFVRRQKNILWKPWLCGFLIQNKRFIIMFAISSGEGDFLNSCNLENMSVMVARMEKIRVLTNARRKTFAGILPGILYSKRLVRESPEADLTSNVVYKCLETVLQAENLRDDSKILIFGGKGFIGKRVVRKLDGFCHVCVLDRDDSELESRNSKISNAKIIIDVSTRNAFVENIECLENETIMINEVYPQPEDSVLKIIKEKNCKCYHVVGVKAKAIPSFPGAYNGAIPCCAAWPSENIECVVKRLA